MTRLELLSTTSKIIGVYMFGKAIEAFGNFGTSLIFLTQLPNSLHILYLLASLFPLFAFLLLSFIFIKSSNRIAQKLCPTHDTNDCISGLNYRTITRTAIFCIGVFTLITTIPALSKLSLLIFQGLVKSILKKELIELVLSLLFGGILTFYPGAILNLADKRVFHE